MAIKLYQGTLNPLSTTLSNDLRVALVGAVNSAIADGYTNWSVTDDGYVNGTTIRSVINNTAGFACMFVNTTATGNANLQLNPYFGESYTVATHVLNNAAFGRNALYTSNASGFSGVNFTHGTTMLADGPTTGPSVHGTNSIIATTAQTNWAALIDDNYMYFSFKDGTTSNGKWIFIGKFDTLVLNPALTDTYPFGMFGRGQTNLFGHILHSLGTPSLNTYHCGAITSFQQNTNVAKTNDYDRYSSTSNKAKLSPIYVLRYNNTILPNNLGSQNGYIRGKLPNALHGGGEGAAWGDTVTVNSLTYMYLGGTAFQLTGYTAAWVRTA